MTLPYFCNPGGILFTEIFNRVNCKMGLMFAIPTEGLLLWLGLYIWLERRICVHFLFGFLRRGKIDVINVLLRTAEKKNTDRE